jgi:hypothetical protein
MLVFLKKMRHDAYQVAVGLKITTETFSWNSRSLDSKPVLPNTKKCLPLNRYIQLLSLRREMVVTLEMGHVQDGRKNAHLRDTFPKQGT